MTEAFDAAKAAAEHVDGYLKAKMKSGSDLEYLRSRTIYNSQVTGDEPDYQEDPADVWPWKAKITSDAFGNDGVPGF